jgi:histidine ammonia-lyase
MLLSTLSLDQIAQLTAADKPKLLLSDLSKERILACRSYLESRLANGSDVIYGINTGFGFLCENVIAREDQLQLQLNLLRSHACGLGSEVEPAIVRLMLILKAQSLSLGHSGVRLVTVQRLLDFYNHDILPVIYTQGSLGASGDLAPLAHLALPLIGEGEVIMQGTPAIASQRRTGTPEWNPVHAGLWRSHRAVGRTFVSHGGPDRGFESGRIPLPDGAFPRLDPTHSATSRTDANGPADFGLSGRF